MRCFIAIDLPQEVKKELSRIQKQLPEAKMKLVKEKNFHLTLFFLGEITDVKVNKIKEELKRVKFEKFKVHLDSLGVFPSENYIRVFWIALKPDDKIKQLREKIGKAISSKDERFETHMTLARVKFVKDKEALIKKLNEIKPKPLEFEIKNFKLKKSTLTREGPIYEDILIKSY